MTVFDNSRFVRHFREEFYDFGLFWKNMEACKDRGIRIYDDEINGILFYPYSEIYSRAGSCAKLLIKHGIRKGDIVLLSAASDIRFIILWLACIWLGAIPATLPPQIAFFSDEIYAKRIREVIPFFKYYICFGNEVPQIEAICHAKNVSLTLIIIHQIFSEINEHAEDFPENNLPAYDDTAFVQFSSGSSGIPKGLMITFRNILNNIRFIFTTLEYDPEISCAGNWLPLYHDMGFVGFLLVTLFTQTNLLLVSPLFFIKRMFDFMRMIQTYRVNFTCMTNSILDIMLLRYKAERCNGICLDSLKWMGVGAEPVSTMTIERIQEIFKNYGLAENVISPCYGLAESTLAVSMAGPFAGFKISRRKGHFYPTVGPIFEGTQVAFRKNSDLPDDVGIIKIKGDCVADYALLEGKRIKITDENGFYDTKDIGYLCDGNLVVIGRQDMMFIVGGENFFPQEIESLIIDSHLLQRPPVVCFSIPPAQSLKHRTELIILYEVNKITPEEKNELDDKLAKLIIKHTGLTIDRFIAAKRGTIVYTTSGKIRYNTMRENYLKGAIPDYFSSSE